MKFAYLFICLVLFISCDKNDHPELLQSKEDTWYWGYFKGTVNEDTIAIENEQYDRKIYSVPEAYYVGESDTIPDSTNIMNTIIYYKNNSELRISLYNIIPGERYLTLPYVMYWYESFIKATINVDSESTKIDYIPSEENPFRVIIKDVIWLSYREPIIEVELDGVLYNKNNPDDTMVIKGCYGAR